MEGAGRQTERRPCQGGSASSAESARRPGQKRSWRFSTSAHATSLNGDLFRRALGHINEASFRLRRSAQIGASATRRTGRARHHERQASLGNRQAPGAFN